VSSPDPLLMSADIVRVAAEGPDLPQGLGLDPEAGGDGVVLGLLEEVNVAAESAGTWASAAASNAAQALTEVGELREEVRYLQASLDDAVELLVDIIRAGRLKDAGLPAEALGLTERQIRDAAATVRKRRRRAPTRDDVAEELHTSVSTLRRAMILLGMRRAWPPAPPEGTD
jgi:hypothetical protein